MKKIAVIGLGYVGLPLAVEFGKVRDVLGYDIDRKRIQELRTGLDRTNECDKVTISSAKKLKYTSSIQDIKDAEIYILTVPTPIDAVNRPNLSPLKSATKAIGKFLNKGDIVIYESTVFPGATEEVCVPILEKESGLEFNVDFFCGYSPERINPGDKVHTLTKIKKITSGSNLATAMEIDELYSSIINAGTHLASSIRVAEAAKVIENTQRDLTIAFVNELAMLFDRLDIDTIEVLEAAGSKWNFVPSRPGLVGGHCIGVDPYYLTHKAEQVGYHPNLILAGRKINDSMADYFANSFIKKILQCGIQLNQSTVGVLGVTFKENCPDIRNSKVFDVISNLESWGLKVKVFDPWADPKEMMDVHGIELHSIEADTQLDALIVAVGHSEFRALAPNDLRCMCRQNLTVIGDVKSIYNKTELEKLNFKVLRL